MTFDSWIFVFFQAWSSQQDSWLLLDSLGAVASSLLPFSHCPSLSGASVQLESSWTRLILLLSMGTMIFWYHRLPVTCVEICYTYKMQCCGKNKRPPCYLHPNGNFIIIIWTPFSVNQPLCMSLLKFSITKMYIWKILYIFHVYKTISKYIKQHLSSSHVLRYAGFLLGIINTFGTIPGVLAPVIMGLLTKDVSCIFHSKLYLDFNQTPHKLINSLLFKAYSSGLEERLLLVSRSECIWSLILHTVWQWKDPNLGTKGQRRDS